MSTLNDFTTWEPLLRLLRASHAERLAAPGGRVSGRIGQHGWSVPLRRPAGAEPDDRAEFDAVERVRAVLTGAGLEDVAFTVEIPPSGRTVLRLLDHGPAVDPGIGNAHPGAVILVEDAVPAPWRRLPDPVPDARPAPSVDLELLERTLRERLPDETGATEEEIAAAEARLGVALPEELKVLYRVTSASWYDGVESQEEFAERAEQADAVGDVLGFELSSLDSIFNENRSRSRFRWEYAATQACVTAPDAAVQDLVWSPGWIVIGDTGGGDLVAVDLTPGPGGHLGQLIVLGHEDSVGGEPFAASLAEAVLGPEQDWYSGRRTDKSPVVARVHGHQSMSVEAVAHPDLEVLTLGGLPEPFSLAPVVGLPRLRTLYAGPGMLADPREIGRLTGLEFLELTPQDWRVLLDAGAVPRSLSAAAITVYGDRADPRETVALTNEILALWDRPRITSVVVEGELGPVS
ncbi:bifunctional protein [Streptomyces rubellomurinus subsp. indigoferus]|nr:bifunctional protein [Streptomyces rubellomurinus subsp. indigoferus]